MAKRKTVAELSQELIAELKKKIYKPIYILTGDESYFIDLIADYIAENVLSESEKAFNQTILYGKDIDVKSIIETSRRFPMMANQQVVIIKEAQQIKKLEELEIYLKAYQKSTILVICHKLLPGEKLGERVKKMFTLASKVGVVFESKRLYDYQIPAWIVDYLKPLGVTISPQSAELLKDFLGNDLSKVVNELDKLIITLPTTTKQITADHVEQNIGISKDFNRFELNNAIGRRDIVTTNRIVDFFAKNPNVNPLILTMSSLYQFFNKVFTYHFLPDKNERMVAVKLGVNPFFVSDYSKAARIYNPKKCVQIFSLLREYDMRSKGVNNESVNHGELLKELVFKIMH
ncbi:MAG: DNA polymerase III subunit delta [Bacteroidales bacterium]|nr:DNA polymerase III subunit delta [Bacteroidales bacterium]MDY0198151.1 DNA polymerase III subunit delta [Tenuifilaceae bacterium]